ncbi:MAG: BlaI/MecI/CopY family transcriptional regulator [Bryobacteraceae bacterium]
MGRSRKIPRPTQAELEILQALWRRGPSTVRQVQEALATKPAAGYTTVLKLLQIMTEKGLVSRDETARAHVYRPTRERHETQQQLLDDLLHRAFGGSAVELMMQALSSQPASAAEIASIRRVLDRFEKGEK